MQDDQPFWKEIPFFSEIRRLIRFKKLIVELEYSSISFEAAQRVNQEFDGAPVGWRETWFGTGTGPRWCADNEIMRATLRKELRPTLGDSVSYNVDNLRSLEFHPTSLLSAASDVSASGAFSGTLPDIATSDFSASEFWASPSPAFDILSSETFNIPRQRTCPNKIKRAKGSPNTRRDRRHRRDQLLIDNALT